MDDLARRYGQLPSTILREDARTLLRMRTLLAAPTED